MSEPNRRLRQLPPSAVRVTVADLRAGLGATAVTHEEFRLALSSYFGVAEDSCFLASSGRAALFTLLRGLQKERPFRTEVVIPAYTCPSVPKVVLDLGLRPIYVDIVPETMRYVPEHLATAVSEGTLAVCLIHPFGIPQPASDVLPQAHAAGAVVIEDAAQAMGSRWQGESVGLAGDYGLFSLGPGKPLSTGGGGIIITGDPELAASLSGWWSELPAAGTMTSAEALARQAAFQFVFHPRSWWLATRLGVQRLGNHEASWGYSWHGLSASQAGVGLALLPGLDQVNARRVQVAWRLGELVEKTPTLENMQIAPGSEPIFLRLPLLADSAAMREALFEQLWSAGIGVGRMYERPLAQIFPQDSKRFPGAESFAARLLTLPTHYHVSDRDVDLIARSLSQL